MERALAFSVFFTTVQGFLLRVAIPPKAIFHNLAGIIADFPFGLAPLASIPALRAEKRFGPSYWRYSIATAAIAAILYVFGPMVGGLSAGISQVVVSIPGMLWLEVVAIKLFRVQERSTSLKTFV